MALYFECRLNKYALLQTAFFFADLARCEFILTICQVFIHICVSYKYSFLLSEDNSRRCCYFLFSLVKKKRRFFLFRSQLV